MYRKGVGKEGISSNSTGNGEREGWEEEEGVGATPEQGAPSTQKVMDEKSSRRIEGVEDGETYQEGKKRGRGRGKRDRNSEHNAEENAQ